MRHYSAREDEMQIPPEDLVRSPVADQINYLDPIMHGCDADLNDFVENFSIQQVAQ